MLADPRQTSLLELYERLGGDSAYPRYTAAPPPPANDNGTSYDVFLKSELWLTHAAKKLKLSPICEYCGAAPSSVVHHRRAAYALGWLAPLKYLDAVCQACHDKCHDYKDLWCEPGMARNKQRRAA